MGGCDAVVMQAIRNVLGRRSSEEWWALPARQRTEAVYTEIRRLDAAAIQERIAARQQSDWPLVYVVA
jgi:hypothetical protein